MKNKFIDYARGFSIFTIVVYHFLFKLKLTKILLYAVSFGGAGVHLFFFASGFGLAQSNYSTYGNFLKRRLRKVLIPYYIVITIIFLINIFIHLYPAGLPEYLSHIFLYKMFIPSYEGSFGVQFWFVSTIIQFYLIFPVLIWALNTNKYLLFFICAFLTSLTYIVLVSLSRYSNDPIVFRFFIQYLWEFVLGMIISRKNLLNKIINQKLIFYFIIAAVNVVITGLLAIKGGRIGKNFDDLFSFTAYTSIVIILYRLGEVWLKPFSKFIFWVTGYSYTLYLVHMFVWDNLKITRLAFVPPVLLFVLVFAYLFDKIVIKKITAFVDKDKGAANLKTTP